jgi:hypothetical protein
MPNLTPDYLLSQGLSSTVIKRFWSKVQKTEGCWTWTAYKTEKGYGRLTRGRPSPIGAHVVSWILHNGPIVNGLCVLHRCDNPTCVNPAHLWLGSRGDNNKDRNDKGRSADPYNVKFTEKTVLEIRSLASIGLSSRQVGDRYAVHKSTIQRIWNRKTWIRVP